MVKHELRHGVISRLPSAPSIELEMATWYHKKVSHGRISTNVTPVTTPEFMHTLSSPKLARALCDKNPKENDLLKKKLEKIERSRKTRHLDLSWDQREFFIKSVFNESDQPRFVKLQDKMGVEKQKLSKSLGNIAAVNSKSAQQKYGSSCSNRETPFSVGKYFSSGLFLPPVQTKESRSCASSAVKRHIDLSSVENSRDGCHSDTADLSDESEASEVVNLPDLYHSYSSTVNTRTLGNRRRSISMHNLTLCAPKEDKEVEEHSGRPRGHFCRRRSISCNDLSTLKLDCVARNRCENRSDLDVYDTGTSETNPNHDPLSASVVSSNPTAQQGQHPVLVRAQTFSCNLQSDAVSGNVAKQLKVVRRADTALGVGFSRPISVISATSSARPLFTKGAHKPPSKGAAKKPLCDVKIINKLTTSLPEHLYRKVKQSATKVAESEGVFDIKEKLIEKNRSISSMNALDDPRWKRLEETLHSIKPNAKIG